MDKKIRESIEACRAARDERLCDELGRDGLDEVSQELVSQELARDEEARLVYDRVHAWDAAIAQSLEGVNVPVGLAERILKGLRSGGKSAAGELLSGSVAAATEATGAGGQIEPAPSESAAWTRRRWAGTAAAGLVSLAVLAALAVYLRQESDVELDLLADQWQARLSDQWQPAAEAPRDFAVPASIRVAPTDWQWVDRYTAVPVAAYRLADAKWGQAMLYVAKMTRAGLPGAAPQSPQSTTGGRAVAYWHSGDKVYVLVVDEERSYRAFVQATATPLA
jgi:hypothetical protein